MVSSARALNIQSEAVMTLSKLFSPQTLRYDLISGVVVFLVALPLCLGVALASNAPLFSGILSGIIGGILVGAVSRSHTSVSGPSPGLSAVVAAQIALLGGFNALLLAVMLAGVLQILLGLFKAGFLSKFVPSSVVKGLLAAIGIILILKQIPHLIGHDADPEGEMAFQQPDAQNTFTEFASMLSDANLGTALIGLMSVVLLIFWDRLTILKKSLVPGPLAVVVLGVVAAEWLQRIGGGWTIPTSAFVQVPVISNWDEAGQLFQFPDVSQWRNPAIYLGAVTIAAAASLETLLNLEAVDKIDPRQRRSPASRELLAQGVGNLTAGLIGAFPMSSVIVRSSVNINAGGRTKLSAITHGVLLLFCVALLPAALNRIPVSCLAGILLVTGTKLASPEHFKQMWDQGRTQFLPFLATVIAIVLTDLLTGVLIGLGVAIAFILHSSYRQPLRCVREHHLQGDLLRIELANQVSFLNRAALKQRLDEVPRGDHVLLDARQTNYLDPDILDLIDDFLTQTAPARGVEVYLTGFDGRYGLPDHMPDIDNSNPDLQRQLTPAQVLKILKDGNERFRTGNRLYRDLGREVRSTARGQFPLAAVLSCIDSRSPAELIFDLGLGDIFSVRIAGNVPSENVLASLEYSCAVAGTKLILVLGHTRCGAVTAAVDLYRSRQKACEVTGCDHLDSLVTEIQKAIDDKHLNVEYFKDKSSCVDEVARRNVLRTMATLRQRSGTLARLVDEGRIVIVGGMYDVSSGEVDIFNEPAADLVAPSTNGESSRDGRPLIAQRE